jgi:hypothetical protein
MDNVRNAATRTAIAVVSIIRQAFLRGRLSPIGGSRRSVRRHIQKGSRAMTLMQLLPPSSGFAVLVNPHTGDDKAWPPVDGSEVREDSFGGRHRAVAW